MVSPEQFIKFQIKSQLHMAGLPEGKSMDELVDEIFEAVFNSNTIASVRQVLADVERSE